MKAMYVFNCAVFAAEVDVDFRGVQQSVTFLPSEPLRTKKCLTIQTFDDSIYEGRERYGLHITCECEFTILNAPGVLYITDNDGKKVKGKESLMCVVDGLELPSLYTYYLYIVRKFPFLCNGNKISARWSIKLDYIHKPTPS